MKPLLILLAALPIAAAAQTYTFADSPEATTTARLDGIQKVGVNMAIWLFTTYKTPRPDGAGSFQTQVEIDCAARKSRTLAASVFSDAAGKGRLLASAGESSWGPIPPGSTMDVARVAVCGSR